MNWVVSGYRIEGEASCVFYREAGEPWKAEAQDSTGELQGYKSPVQVGGPCGHKADLTSFSSSLPGGLSFSVDCIQCARLKKIHVIIFKIGLGRLCDGYPALSARAARDPDNEAFIFRYRLIALENEIDQLETPMKHADDPTGMRQCEERIQMNFAANVDKTLLLQAQTADFKLFPDYLEGHSFKGDGMDSMPITRGRAKDFLAEESDLRPLDRITIYKNITL
ncbi:uncharacterized protein BDR25DRAFT_357988 [Lindgomyces ingoldianus]|uniref:Uncharacterized protein n=1 Tax=Lindgomyces ingoldianus TaxID=673940 RepID=A0ACB6QQ77_9PLEO|nr:uncharacterized protein BDR25DRAFT_357988 [Lindgomyces ingoldianus]KAF2468260.1 hypothetical protein BDR25DRAFT_357988 [Lindgomyces ingoldianus]